MNEDQLARLRDQLERRKNRLKEANAAYFSQKLRLFYDFLTSNPILASILHELSTNQARRLAALAAQTTGNSPMPGVYPPPQVACEQVAAIENDSDHAALAYHLVRGVVKEGWPLEAICLVMYKGDPQANFQLDYSTFH